MIIDGQNIIPILRIEKIIAGEDLEPITRAEMIINGEELTGVTAFQQYLKKVFQNYIPSAEDLTRLEKILNGEDLKPITRLEYLLTERMKDPELPLAYSRLDKIEFNGSFYYNTLEKLYGTDIVTMTVNYSGSQGNNLFGSFQSSATDALNLSLYIYGSTTGQAYFRYRGSLFRPLYGGGRRTISFGKGGTTGFATNTSMSIADDFVTTDYCYIGNLPNSTANVFSGEIIGNIMVSDRLKYIPCRRDEDGVIGYYETHTGKFLEPISV